MPTPPSDHIPLGRRCAVSASVALRERPIVADSASLSIGAGAGLAFLCSAGDILLWIKAVCSKFRGIAGIGGSPDSLGTPRTRLGGRLPGAASSRQSPAFCVMLSVHDSESFDGLQYHENCQGDQKAAYGVVPISLQLCGDQKGHSRENEQRRKDHAGYFHPMQSGRNGRATSPAI